MTKVSPYHIEMTEHVRPATKDHIARFQSQFGRIPGEYQRFLTQQNGGTPKKCYLKFAKGPYSDLTIKFFLGITPKGERSLQIALHVYSGRIPDQTFPVARDTGGNLVLLSTKSPRGNVLFWDHEQELQKQATTVVANSLLRFLELLEPASEGSKPTLIVVQYADGSSERKVVPYPYFSVDRQKLVDAAKLLPGERIEEWGNFKTVARIDRIAPS